MCQHAIVQDLLTDLGKVCREWLAHECNIRSVLQVLVDRPAALRVLLILEMCHGHHQLIVVWVDICHTVSTF